jgi:hypothetical protein
MILFTIMKNNNINNNNNNNNNNSYKQLLQNKVKNINN